MELLQVDPNTGVSKWVNIGDNKVLLVGLQKLCQGLYDGTDAFSEKTFEERLYTEDPCFEDLRPFIQAQPLGYPHPYRYIGAFNISKDGAQGDAQIYQARHKDGIDFEEWVPFRRIPKDINDFTVYKPLYAHHREVVKDGVHYIDYYSKFCTINYSALLEDGTSVPDFPNVNLNTDRDTRFVASFTINLSKEEMIEWFRTEKAGGSASAGFNSTCLMMGIPAKINLDDTLYNTFTDSYVFAKCNHQNVPHGASGTIVCRYKILHI